MCVGCSGLVADKCLPACLRNSLVFMIHLSTSEADAHNMTIHVPKANRRGVNGLEEEIRFKEKTKY